MKVLKAIGMLLITVLIAASSCGGGDGGGQAPSLPSQAGGGDGVDDLRIVTFTASPTLGGSPLGVNFIATVSGGTMPYTYMWDYDNDGAFDFYINDVASRTEQAYHLYYLRAADQSVGISVYQATVRVVDDAGESMTSEPLAITVTSEPQFSLDPSLTRVFSDTVLGYDAEGEPIYGFISGEPAYFRVFPDPLNPGTPPYRFQWDFDGDGETDSVLQNPQYTYTLFEGTSKSFVAVLLVTDANGYTVRREFPLVVIKEVPSEPTGPPELIVNASPPVRSDGSILISFDSSSEIPAEREPVLHASVTVDPDHPGIEPYAFWWDFTDDGIYDANTTTASVPYYDADLKIMVNPYITYGAASRDYTLALQFVDGVGQIIRMEWPVHVVDRAYEPVVNPLTTQIAVYADYDRDGGFDLSKLTDDRQEYLLVQPNTGIKAAIRVTAGGSTGIYKFLIDLTGEDVYAEASDPGALVPNGDPVELAWDPEFDGTYEPVDLDGDPETVDATIQLFGSGTSGSSAVFVVNFPVTLLPGYKAIKVKTVALSEAGLELANRVEHTPLSFVARRNLDATGVAFKPRRDFGLAAVTIIDDRGTPDLGDDRYKERRVYAVGGMDGNMALRSVQLLRQKAELTTGTWILSYEVSDRLPLSNGRGQLIAEPLSDYARGTTSVPYIYAIGGYNNIQATVSTVERLPAIDSEPDDPLDRPVVPWEVVGTIGNSDTELRQMAAIFGINYGGNASIIMLGGLRGDPPGEQVSPTGWLYTPGTNSWYTGVIPAMPTPRYDSAMVVDAPSQNAIYLYVIGGRNNQGQSVHTVERVNLLTGGWEILPDMRNARAGATAEVINGKIYVYGGVDYPFDQGAPTYVAEAEVFNPDTYRWSRTVSPDPGVGRVGAGSVKFATFMTDGNPTPYDTIWIVGGETEQGVATAVVELQVEALANLQ